jgi:hypothetical protein
MERRTGQRIDLKLECHVFRPGVDVPLAEGLTVNMSHGGALVTVQNENPSRLPKVNNMVELEVPLPQQEPFPQRCLLCKASVSRVSLIHPGTYLVALKFHRVSFGELHTPRRRAGKESAVAKRKLMMM